MDLSENLNKKFQNQHKIDEVDTFQEYRKWSKQIPYINFPIDLGVIIMAPPKGAIIRFLIKRKNSDTFMSVYLDCYDRLGVVGEPYWEIYNSKNDDAYRCPLEENSDELLKNINWLLGNKRIKFKNPLKHY